MQTDVVWADPEANRRKLDAMLSGLPETDGGTLRWMLKQAREHGFALAGSISTEEDGRLYNRFCFVEPDGKVTDSDSTLSQIASIAQAYDGMKTGFLFTK